ncbi:MAG: endo-1,4-beta-xylanase [Mariniphaga sp.]
MKNNQNQKIVCLFIVSILIISQSEGVFAVGKNNKNIEDKDLTIRQIIEKYYSDSYFHFGCISKATYLEDGNSDVNFYLKEFSYNVPENQFKQSQVYPEPDSKWNDFNYKGLIELARKNKQIMRAHSPISPQCSRWVKADNRTSEELENVMKHYVDNISKDIEANSDVIKWIDVVNETVVSNTISDSVYSYNTGDWFGPLLGNSRWQNPWTIIGYEADTELKVPKYIPMAFEIANKNAPSIKMLYNQHGGMEKEAWEKIKRTIIYLRSKGLRVDAVGWQAHIPYGFEKVDGNMEYLNNLIDWCYENNLEFHVTEIDIKMGKNINNTDFTEKAEEVADTYGAITEAMVKKIGKGAVSINCWAMKHRRRKTEGSFAGLFDDELKPTPAYYRIKKVLLENAPAEH